MDWAEAPTVAITPAHLGNRLYHWFAAQTLIDRLGIGTVSGADFPDWGLRMPREDPRRYRAYMAIREPEDFDLGEIAARVRDDPSLFIQFQHPMQRHSLYLGKDRYSALLPITATDLRVCSDSELLINIRTGDILSGWPHWYPLTPIAFFQDVVRDTGLTPVFVGQLAPGLYTAALRAAFPDAEFINSRGAATDFDTVRSARHIVPAISTFSTAAAWLSSDRTIHLPLSGFLNPAHLRGYDLLPLEDPRYRFYLFPLNYALPEAQALAHHRRLEGTWREISRGRLRVLRDAAPLIAKNFRESSIQAHAGFDERFYVHQHLDVARDVSEGWYEDGFHHYVDIGRALGYPPQPDFRREPYPNLALGGRAWQSSISQWSAGRTIQDDAMLAVNGDPAKDAPFHTAHDQDPWWMVDCGRLLSLREIRIHNRRGPRSLQERASPLAIEVSPDGAAWALLRQTAHGEVFGDEASGWAPLSHRPAAETILRYVRIRLPGQATHLHLNEVEVYGIPL